MTTAAANALCFGHDLPATGVPCRVEVPPSGLTIQFVNLPLETIPFAALFFEAGGFDRNQLLVRWTHNGLDRRVYVKDAALIRSLRDVLPAEVIGGLEITAQRVRAVERKRRAFVWVTAVSTVALLVTLWFSFDALVRMAVSRVPVEWEQRIGESARRNILAGQTVIQHGVAAAAVQEIARRLAAQVPGNPYRFEVSLIKNDQVNALAVPGGAIIVFTGLLKQAKSAEEVAGVLAHEMSHVLLRHGLHGTVKNLGTLVAMKILLGNQEGLTGFAEQLGIQLTKLTFSRRMEIEADLAGVDLLHRAQISPSGMIRFFERFSERDRRQVEVLASHPMSAERAERLRSHAAAWPSEAVMPIDFDWKEITASL